MTNSHHTDLKVVFGLTHSHSGDKKHIEKQQLSRIYFGIFTCDLNDYY